LGIELVVKVYNKDNHACQETYLGGSGFSSSSRTGMKPIDENRRIINSGNINRSNPRMLGLSGGQERVGSWETEKECTKGKMEPMAD